MITKSNEVVNAAIWREFQHNLVTILRFDELVGNLYYPNCTYAPLIVRFSGEASCLLFSEKFIFLYKCI